nr:hypothetical protein Iba_chr11cCG13080 [Ipomoea batatas]
MIVVCVLALPSVRRSGRFQLYNVERKRVATGTVVFARSGFRRFRPNIGRTLACMDCLENQNACPGNAPYSSRFHTAFLQLQCFITEGLPHIAYDSVPSSDSPHSSESPIESGVYRVVLSSLLTGLLESLPSSSVACSFLCVREDNPLENVNLFKDWLLKRRRLQIFVIAILLAGAGWCHDSEQVSASFLKKLHERFSVSTRIRDSCKHA